MDSVPRCLLVRYPQVLPAALRGGAVTIGNFDGLHLGHQHVITTLCAAAQGASSTVISFYPHPLQVLRRAQDLRLITSVREKCERLAELEVAALYLLHFTPELAQMTAQEFIERVLVRALGARVLVMGEDGALGKGREGDLAYLRTQLPRYGIELRVVPTFEMQGVRPSSRALRACIAQGDLVEAQRLLGRPFALSARVCHGDKRGAALGFPTMNIAVGRRLVPARGVYVCYAKLGGRCYPAVANIGIRPTFDGGVAERLEVHILDHSPGQVYGERVEVSFIDRLRDEERFASVQELTQQISRDVERARTILTQRVV